MRAALQVGVAQLLFLETPHHAAIKETVETVRTYGILTNNDISEQLIKFVNGVLRHISRNVEEYRNAYKPTENLAPWFREKLIGENFMFALTFYTPDQACILSITEKLLDILPILLQPTGAKIRQRKLLNNI